MIKDRDSAFVKSLSIIFLKFWNLIRQLEKTKNDIGPEKRKQAANAKLFSCAIVIS